MTCKASFATETEVECTYVTHTINTKLSFTLDSVERGRISRGFLSLVTRHELLHILLEIKQHIRHTGTKVELGVVGNGGNPLRHEEFSGQLSLIRFRNLGDGVNLCISGSLRPTDTHQIFNFLYFLLRLFLGHLLLHANFGDFADLLSLDRSTSTIGLSL